MRAESSQQQFIMAMLLTMGVGLLYAQLFIIRPSETKDPSQKQNSVEQEKKNPPSRSTGGEKQTPSTSTTEGKQTDSETEPAEQETPQQTDEESPSTNHQENQVSNGASPANEEGQKIDSSSGAQPESTHVLENKEIRIKFSNRSATVRSYTLKNHYETAKKETPLQMVSKIAGEKESFEISGHNSDFSLKSNHWKAVSKSSPGTISFQQTTRSGLTIQKTFTLDEENPYFLNYDVTIKNGPEPVDLGQVRLHGLTGITLISSTDASYHTGIQGLKNGGEWNMIKEPDPNSLKDKLQKNKDLAAKDVTGSTWIGVINKYFSSLMIVTSDLHDLVGYQFSPVDISQETAHKNVGAYTSLIPYFITSTLELSPNKTREFSFTYFIGPKDETLLESHKMLGFPLLTDFGWFGFISEFLLTILHFLYNIIGNYGFAIIMLTILVKACLHPLIRKSYVSMHKMKKLQPKIEQLKEKYGDDKQKLGEKQMELFKEHGVNPLGGCLPMVLQMPILFGLYWGIRQSFALRQQPFFGWINDLSRPDRFMELPGSWSLFGISFEYLNLLVVLMMITWLFQAFTQPRPSGGGETAQFQSKMMKFMPLGIGIIFYNFPSGLVLYWFTNTLFSTIEQLYIRNYVVPEQS